MRQHKTLNLNKPVFVGRTPTGGMTDPHRLHWLALRQKESQIFVMRLTHYERNPTEYKQSCDAELLSMESWQDYIDSASLVIRSQHPILNDPTCYPVPSAFPFEWIVNTPPNRSIRCRLNPPIEMGNDGNRHSLICPSCQSYDLIWMNQGSITRCAACGRYARIPKVKKPSSHRAKSFTLHSPTRTIVEIFNLRKFCAIHGYPYEAFHVRVVQDKANYLGWRMSSANPVASWHPKDGFVDRYAYAQIS